MHHLIMRRFLVSPVYYASCIVLSLHRQGQGKNVRLISKYSILTIEFFYIGHLHYFSAYYDIL